MFPDAEPLIQLSNITKTFPGGVKANDDVSLAVHEGAIHAVIGENGAGKSTLMNILFGRYQPDSGRIRIQGADVRIASPAEAIALGIGMVTQHTTLIPALTTLENIILGAEPTSAGVIDRGQARRRIAGFAESLGVTLDWNAPAGSLSVAALQKAEIVKALYRGARILILDEPTATLAPQEANSLFQMLHTLVDSGATAIMITHKLREVMAHSSRVTVLRGGKTVGERLTNQTYPEDLLNLMLGQRTVVSGQKLGRDIELGEPTCSAPWERGPSSEMLAGSLQTDLMRNARPLALNPPCLELKNVCVRNNRRAPAVRDVSLAVYPGEVVGVAGVDGSGQQELAEAIVGLRRADSGSVWLGGEEITRRSIAGRMRAGIAYVPEDRHREGLVLDFTIAENMILGREREPNFCGGRLLDLGCIRANGDAAVRNHRIRAGGGDVPASTLSGGNQQKVVLARALEGSPRLLVSMQPTRGLDVEATRFVYETLRRALAAGLGILLFSLDLDEIFEMSARIAVMYNGTIAGTMTRAEATPELVGELMLSGSRDRA